MLMLTIQWLQSNKYKVLLPFWYTIPHDASGRVYLQSRYRADRYFIGAFDMRLRGFEARNTVTISDTDPHTRLSSTSASVNGVINHLLACCPRMHPNCVFFHTCRCQCAARTHAVFGRKREKTSSISNSLPRCFTLLDTG